MKVTAYTLDGCSACESQKKKLNTLNASVDIYEVNKNPEKFKDIDVAPTLDIECGNGKTYRTTGLQDKDDIKSVCDL